MVSFACAEEKNYPKQSISYNYGGLKENYTFIKVKIIRKAESTLEFPVELAHYK